jgi:hypothetical protein
VSPIEITIVLFEEIARLASPGVVATNDHGRPVPKMDAIRRMARAGAQLAKESTP